MEFWIGKTMRLLFIWTFLICAALIPAIVSAEELSACAEVQIEIAQELTLERQAFDAHMRITNGLEGKSLDQVKIDVLFEDDNGKPVEASSNPNHPTAIFFIRVDSMKNITNISGSGVVAPQTVADIHWLIIPAAGAAGTSLVGKLYFIGATLTYNVGSKGHKLEVAPDFVVVRPMPMLELDYFLPKDVRADDPFTSPIEPPEPFTLGVRVKNSGLGAANKLAIQSAQPQIVENRQNLLIGFKITGSYVDDQPVKPTLLMDFGNVAAASARNGRWIMETTLSGKFQQFTASYSHADALGGRLTSLLKQVRTHRLVRDVLVDLPGRDGIRDFLAEDASILTVYESDGNDTIVTDHSTAVQLVYDGQSGGNYLYHMDIPKTAGFLYVKVPDPYSGQKVIYSVIRADRKNLAQENVWFAAHGSGTSSTYSLSIFDTNGGGRYFIEITDARSGPRPPVLQLIPNYQKIEGQRLTFVVKATDPDNTIPILSVDQLPLGATFVDNRDGTGQFDWPTRVGQMGKYPVTFRASDGVLFDLKTPTLTILSSRDTDRDGMDDAWEIKHFGNLNRDGKGDFDGDGLTDLEEFQRNTDPTWEANAPTVPVIDTPLWGHEVNTLQPTLVVLNSKHGIQVPSYEFELYYDEEFTVLANRMEQVEGPKATSWVIDSDLVDNTWYYWRVRSELAAASSAWVYGKFFVNSQNDAPQVPVPLHPLNDELVDSYTPTLTVTNVIDPDEDEVAYIFGVVELNTNMLVYLAFGVPESSNGTTSATALLPAVPTAKYAWAVLAIDEHAAMNLSAWSQFKIDTGGIAPLAPLQLSPVGGAVQASSPMALVSKAVSSNSLDRYFIEVDTVKTFNSVARQSVSIAAQGNTVTASISSLQDNTEYFWRIRAFNGKYYGPWSEASFVVNTSNDKPAIPVVRNPGLGGRVDDL
ncbi:fibronectin type III domain-containing protein, partial [Oligoflexia bacterium]|nr:fibronectin type III domain-containing protein [Oligoflexia bacterium]